MSTSSITSQRDPELHAHIVRRVELHYANSAHPSLDRPQHVRAGSGLAWLGSNLAVVQDDANFVALVDPLTGAADSITLPHGPGNRRQFADALGNKHDKFDFEAIVRLTGDADILLLVGSGSSVQRERITIIDLAHGSHDVRVLHIPAFYDALRRTGDFAGSDMNIEGVVQMAGVLRFFGRGNGAANEQSEALDATCDIDIASFLAYVHAPHLHAPPQPRNVVRFDLGTLRGMKLSFTDATILADKTGRTNRVVYLAAAEDSPDATRDGEVTGSALGIIDSDSDTVAARYTELLDEHGEPLHAKAEGIAFANDDSGVAYIVLDVDAADQPSELCEVRLRGFL